MFEKILENVKETTPIVHAITNYVTVNDCANVLLAAGGSPIMADDIDEVEEIVAIAGALVLNIGTLNRRTVAAMLKAGKKANALQIPVVLDPVGVGASGLRNEAVARLMEEIQFAVIRGNASEIKTIGAQNGHVQGVDAATADQIHPGNIGESVAFAKELAKRTGAVIAMTGAIDIVASPAFAYAIQNGHPQMGKISGTGCMLSCLIGAYCAANRDEALEAAAAAVTVMGISGELAQQKAEREGGGNGAMRIHLLDFVGKVDKERLTIGGKVERL